MQKQTRPKLPPHKRQAAAGAKATTRKPRKRVRAKVAPRGAASAKPTRKPRKRVRAEPRARKATEPSTALHPGDELPSGHHAPNSELFTRHVLISDVELDSLWDESRQAIDEVAAKDWLEHADRVHAEERRTSGQGADHAAV